MTALSTEVTLDVISCCAVGCGVRFGIEANYNRRLIEKHGTFYCPNGHSQHHLIETEADRLRKQLSQTEKCLTFAREQRDSAQRREKEAEKSVAARKGVITRMKRRIKSGRCVCCSHQFKDLERHMQNKHPNFEPEKHVAALEGKSETRG